MTLQVSKLSKRQGDHWLFRDVEFDVAGGEIFGIFSQNADASRSILELIAGTDKSNGGTITGEGVQLFQTSKDGSVVSRIFGKSAENSRVASSDLSSFVASTKPQFLLIDQPFRDLDRSERDRVAKLFRETRDAGRSVVFTSSDFDDMLEFADRVSILAAGYVEQTAAPQEIYDEPASVAVAAVVGRSNLIEARRLTSSKSETPEYITINGEHRLFTRRTAKAALGALNQNITLMIRPEQISISFGASFPEDNLLKATVAAVTPMGATTRVELDCDGLRLEALVLRLVGLNIGEECMVGLPPDRIIVLRA
jgi:ABC-type spermidine/putrescine transport systems, ATPase components